MAEERGARQGSVSGWIPLLAAVVGLGGGAIGAYVGGSVANEGQQQRFENEQTAETRNFRLDAYSELLRACETAYFIAREQTGKEVNEAVAALTAARAKASLVTSSTEVREAARELGPDFDPDGPGGKPPHERACGHVPRRDLNSAERRFIGAAESEVTGE
jgi:hypothetical protein